LDVHENPIARQIRAVATTATRCVIPVHGT
jgi:hypothetical protein